MGQCSNQRYGPVPDQHGNHQTICDPWRVLDVVGGKDERHKHNQGKCKDI